MKFKSDEQRRAVMANIGNPSSGSSKKKKKWGISLKGGWKSYAVLDKKPDEKELENLRGEFSNRGYDLGVVSSDKETILTYRPKQALEQPKENPLKVFGAMGTQEEYAESAKNKKWIEAVLSNDEESSDEELIDHFMKEGKISRSQAESWVLLRGDYLRGEMNAKPEPEKRWVLSSAFHPTAFQDKVYSVSFRQEGKPLLDRYTELFMVEATDKSEAIKKAEVLLMEKEKAKSKPEIPKKSTQEEYAESAKNKKWIEAVLSNDEESSDEELIEHFMKEGQISRKEAESWVLLRGDYLNGDMDGVKDPLAKSIVRQLSEEQAEKTQKMIDADFKKESEIKSKKSKNTAFYRSQAYDAMEKGQFNKAVKLYEKAIANYPPELKDKSEWDYQLLNDRLKEAKSEVKSRKSSSSQKSFSWKKVGKGVYQTKDTVKGYDYVIEKTEDSDEAVFSIFDSKIKDNNKAFIKSLRADSVSDAKLLAEEWDK